MEVRMHRRRLSFLAFRGKEVSKPMVIVVLDHLGRCPRRFRREQGKLEAALQQVVLRLPSQRILDRIFTTLRLQPPVRLMPFPIRRPLTDLHPGRPPHIRDETVLQTLSAAAFILMIPDYLRVSMVRV
jgi:hypothetical protein